MRCWDRRAPHPRKLSACNAVAVLTHVTCENGAGDTFPAAKKVNSVKERDGGFNTDQYSFPPDPYQGARKGPRARRTGPASPPAHAGEHRSVTPSRSRRTRRNALTPEHEEGHPNLRTPHCSTHTPATEAARHGTIRHRTGRQLHTRAPHHRAGAAPWGSHGEHGDAPRGTEGALPPTGVYI